MSLTPVPNPLSAQGAPDPAAMALALLDLHPGAATLVLDEELCVVFARGQALRVEGRDVESIEGQPVSELMPAARFAEVEPRLRAGLRGVEQSFVLPAGEADLPGWAVEIRRLEPARAGDGQLLAMQIRQRASSGDEQRLRAVMEALSEGIVVQDHQGVVVDCNPAALKILGLERGELLGRGPVDQVWRTVREDGAPYPPEQHPAIVTLRSGVELDATVMGVDKRDGQRTWISVTTRLLRQPGEPTAVVNSIVDITERRRLLARLRAAADRDPLTELVNRRRFGEDLATQLARCRRVGEPAAIVLMDLDRFKSVNDSFGHQAGDQLLIAVAHSMLSRLRGSDTLARLGGDEFAVLLPGADRADGERVALELVEIVRLTAEELAPGLGVAASAGVAIVDPADGVPTPDDALAAADRALYAAKGGVDRR